MKIYPRIDSSKIINRVDAHSLEEHATYQFSIYYLNKIQGFLPVEASILEVEAWGFGGSTAKEIQNSYKKREELFTEQRRKVKEYLILIIPN